MSLANQLPRLNTPPQVGGLSKYHRSVSKARGRITLWGCADRTVNSNSHGDVYFACLRASGQSWLSTSEWSIIYIAAGRNSFSIKVVSWRRSLSSFLCRPISCVDFFFFFFCAGVFEKQHSSKQNSLKMKWNIWYNVPHLNTVRLFLFILSNGSIEKKNVTFEPHCF